MRFDVVYTFIYILDTQYFNKYKNKKSEFFCEFLKSVFLAYLASEYYFCQRKPNQGMKSKTQQSAKNLRPQAREKNYPKRKTQEKRTTNSTTKFEQQPRRPKFR